MMQALTPLDAMNDPSLFGSFFEGPSWGAWRTFVSVCYGLPIDAEGEELFRALYGAHELRPARRWLSRGRRDRRQASGQDAGCDVSCVGCRCACAEGPLLSRRASCASREPRLP